MTDSSEDVSVSYGLVHCFFLVFVCNLQGAPNGSRLEIVNVFVARCNNFLQEKLSICTNAVGFEDFCRMIK